MSKSTEFKIEQFSQSIGAAATTAARAIAGLLYDLKRGTGLLDLPLPAIEGKEDQLFTISEACNLLRISRSTFSRRIKQHGIRPVKKLLPIIRYRETVIEKLSK